MLNIPRFPFLKSEIVIEIYTTQCTTISYANVSQKFSLKELLESSAKIKAK